MSTVDIHNRGSLAWWKWAVCILLSTNGMYSLLNITLVSLFGNGVESSYYVGALFGVLLSVALPIIVCKKLVRTKRQLLIILAASALTVLLRLGLTALLFG